MPSKHKEIEIRDPKTKPEDKFIKEYLSESVEILNNIDRSKLSELVAQILKIRELGGRLFFIGVGGSAANCSHAVNDFRKIAGIECYTPSDNVSELSARANDEGWDTIFSEWLKTSRLSSKDGLFVLSVGGGNLEKNISPNIVTGIQHAKSVEATVLGIVGREDGFTAKEADTCVIIPNVNHNHITPHSEAFQSVIWHLLVTHPNMKLIETKWESTAAK